jgi:uncharacterized protein VirK/YbjX
MYFVPFMQMAQQKANWSPQRLRRFVCSIASNPGGQIELLRIFSLPAFRTLVLLDPIFPVRHLSRDFLFRGLSTNERTASILHHYRFLKSRIPNRILHQFGHWEIPVIEDRKNGRAFTVTLGLPPKNALWEGESLLQLKADGAPVYQLQFTIVPGWVLQTEPRDVVFVQRLQGMKGCFQEIGAATKAFGDVAPPLLLLTALQGIATAWGISEMACISASSQYSSRFHKDERSSALYRQAYDDFFLKLGARRITADFFSLSLPFGEKPIELISNGHKARTRRKRAIRHEIANRASQTILEAG